MTGEGLPEQGRLHESLLWRLMSSRRERRLHGTSYLVSRRSARLRFGQTWSRSVSLLV